MTGGGLIGLTKYGSQNVILSGNPQMTYFYKAFKRYSHFAMESITIPLEGPNELSYDRPTTLRTKIPRYGDLLSDLYFSFQIPDIYSKYVVPQDPTTGRISQFDFKWVRYLGTAIIQSAAFFIGGQKIQEFDGSYLLSRALIDMNTDMLHKWKNLVGDVPELNDPANGMYAGGSTGTGYPTVIQDPTKSSAEQANRPSIFGRDIHVPLGFWFSEALSQALPLVGLQSQDCEVRITLNPIQQLYTVTDISGYRVCPEYRMNAPLVDIQQNKPDYASAQDISGQIRFFFTDIGFSAPPLNSWFINPRLQGTFIYLSKDEQVTFATRPLSYIITQNTPYPFPGLYSRHTLDLQVHNPVTRLVFVQRRSDSINRNDFANFTNWANYPNPPFQPTPGLPVTNYPTSFQDGYSSGLQIPNAQMNMLRFVRVLCDGNEIQEQKPIDYFTQLSLYKYASGIGADGLPIYTFQLTSPGIQPSGSINSSLIRNFQVEVAFWDLPVNPTYTYNLTIYAENINWLIIASGTGGLKFAL
jgi:hypothetical protein